tara:strand:- start:2486 stop:3214 length:729 start_codon:yes stop_codon:yes gene_type:complete
MAKGNSAQKIAQAEKAGSIGGTSDRRRLGFPIAMACVVILGLLLVGWSRSNREATSAPRVGDHWHSAYDVYNCAESESTLESREYRGGWRSKFIVERVANGIHTHGDGLIHIHPSNSLASGNDAQLGEFFEAFGGFITDSSVKLDTGEVITEGFTCEGKPAVLKVARFDVENREREPQVYTENLKDVKFLKNLEAFTVAFVPEDYIPPPPRPERFTYLETVDPRAILSDNPVLELPVSDTTG